MLQVRVAFELSRLNTLSVSLDAPSRQLHVLSQPDVHLVQRGRRYCVPGAMKLTVVVSCVSGRLSVVSDVVAT